MWLSYHLLTKYELLNSKNAEIFTCLKEWELTIFHSLRSKIVQLLGYLNLYVIYHDCLYKNVFVVHYTV